MLELLESCNVLHTHIETLRYALQIGIPFYMWFGGMMTTTLVLLHQRFNFPPWCQFFLTSALWFFSHFLFPGYLTSLACSYLPFCLSLPLSLLNKTLGKSSSPSLENFFLYLKSSPLCFSGRFLCNRASYTYFLLLCTLSFLLHLLIPWTRPVNSCYCCTRPQLRILLFLWWTWAFCFLSTCLWSWRPATWTDSRCESPETLYLHSLWPFDGARLGRSLDITVPAFLLGSTRARARTPRARAGTHLL